MSIEKAKELCRKYAKATEFFDPLIENRFVELPILAKDLINSAAQQILDELEGEKMAYETEFNEYLRLYKERYGDSGPSISSSCGGKNKKNCGCWTCHLQKLRKGE